MGIFSDRRSWKQIGGLRAYLRQVCWSLHWRIGWRRRLHRTLDALELASQQSLELGGAHQLGGDQPAVQKGAKSAEG